MFNNDSMNDANSKKQNNDIYAGWKQDNNVVNNQINNLNNTGMNINQNSQVNNYTVNNYPNNNGKGVELSPRLENEEKPYLVVSDEQLKNKKVFGKVISVMTFLLFIIVGIVIYGGYIIDKYEFYINKNEVSIGNKCSYQIELTPKNIDSFDYKNYVYKSHNDNIAVVDDTGKITAVGVGETEVEVKYKYGMTSKTIKVKTEELNNIEIKSKYGDGQIETEVKGREDLKVDVTYKPVNPENTDVDRYGHVEIPSGESETIIVTPIEGEPTYVEIPSEPVIIEVEKIELVENSILLQKGTKGKITARVFPENATNKEVRYTSNNENVIVENDGTITGKNVGSSIITVSSNNEKVAYCNISVIEDVVEVTGIDLNPEEIEIKVGESKELIAEIVPSNATDRELIWETSDPNIVSVTNGKITANGVGEAEIIVKTKNGKIQTSSKIKVIAKEIAVSELKVKDNNISLKIGSTYGIQVEILPDNATNKKLTYTSNNNNIVVDATGMVTAKSVGNSIVTIKSSNGKKVNVNINVTKNVIPVESVSLDNTNIELNKGAMKQIIATIYPNNATDRTLTWVSNNPNVVTVDNGKIVGKSGGTATVIVTSASGKSASVNVKVIVPVTGVKITGEDKIKVGSTTTYKVEVTPSDASDKSIIWESSNSNVVTIDKNGKITGKSPGTATIKAISSNGVKVSKTITVETKDIPVNGITLSPSEITLEIGHSDTKSLSIVYTPSNATSQGIKEWKSSDTKIAVVDANGVVTAKGVGTTTVTAISLNGKKSSCKVTVKPNSSIPTGISLNYTGTQKLDVGGTLTLKATLTPSTAVDTLSFTSNNEKIAGVNSKGKITGKSEGTAIITVKTSDGKIKTSVTVLVNKVEAKSINLNLKSLKLKAGETATLTATTSPANASSDLTWISSNSSVATVNKNGLITAKGEGSTTITVKTSNGKTASCNVVVEKRETLKVHFISLGSTKMGDAIFIQVGNKNILVDGGMARVVNSKTGMRQVDFTIDYLNQLNIKKIDYYIGSHGHNDHVGGAAELIKKYDIQHIIVGDVNDSSNTYSQNATLNAIYMKSEEYNVVGGAKKAKAIIENGTRVIQKISAKNKEHPEVILEINGLKITCLGPINPTTEPRVGHQENNLNSLILRLDYGNKSFLLSGDAGDSSNVNHTGQMKEYSDIIKKGEEWSNLLNVDVYKNGHHYASKTDKVISYIKPTYIVFPTDDNLPTNEPKADYIDILKKYGTKYFYMLGLKQNGTVVFETDGNTLSANPQFSSTSVRVRKDTVNVNQEFTRHAIVSPINAETKILKCEVSDESIVKVVGIDQKNRNCIFKGLKTGKATFKIQVQVGNSKIWSNQTSITVSANQSNIQTNSGTVDEEYENEYGQEASDE